MVASEVFEQLCLSALPSKEKRGPSLTDGWEEKEWEEGMGENCKSVCAFYSSLYYLNRVWFQQGINPHQADSMLSLWRTSPESVSNDSKINVAATASHTSSLDVVSRLLMCAAVLSQEMSSLCGPSSSCQDADQAAAEKQVSMRGRLNSMHFVWRYALETYLYCQSEGWSSSIIHKRACVELNDIIRLDSTLL